MKKLRTGAFARLVGFSERIAREYADKGLVPSERDSTGARLFDEAAVCKARALYAQRTAKNRRASA